MPAIFDCHIHCSDNEDDILLDYARASGQKYDLPELLGLMEKNDVGSGLLLSPPLRSGRPLPNRDVIELCRRSKDRLYPIVTVEPTTREVIRCLEIAKQNKGYVKGFKVLLGYFPTFPQDKVYSRIYDYAEKWDLPVMFHTGDTATRNGSLEHARPLALDVVANEREDLKIVVCHFGNPWFAETAELLYKHPNVYADVSGLFCVGAKYSNSYLRYLSRALSEAIYFVGKADKVLFGTDYPIERYSDAMKLVNSLKIEKGDVSDILSRNARRIFEV